jgi:transcriptional regulator of acetoin/glycerol metabolism
LIADILHRAGARKTRLSVRVARQLLSHKWPLNIRELENVLTVASALANQGVVEWAHLPESLTNAPAQHIAGVDTSLNSDDQQQWLESLLRQHQGNVSAVARVTGKSRMQIHRWLQKYAIDLEQFRR